MFFYKFNLYLSHFVKITNGVLTTNDKFHKMTKHIIISLLNCETYEIQVIFQ